MIPANDPLKLDADEMRQLGYKVVDMLVDYHQTIRDSHVVPPKESVELYAEALAEFQKEPRALDELLESVRDDVFANSMNLIHPRFFAYVPGPATFVSAMGEALAAGFNVFAGTTPHNLGPAKVERDTIRWLCDLAGLGESSGGLFVSGGSMASLTALYAAKVNRLNGKPEHARFYVSDQTHSCIERALSILGFSEAQLVTVRCDREFRMDPRALAEAVQSDRSKGHVPLCVIATAGTTNTGAIDPLEEIATIATTENLWMHVDAALGGPVLLSETDAHRLRGIERADSVAMDAHKWMFQSFECGICLVAEQDHLSDAYRRVPAYMRDTDSDIPNYRDLGPQVTRAFKAFKLWFSLQLYGERAFRMAVQKGIDQAGHAAGLIQAMPGWELVTKPSAGVLTFRYRGDHTDQDALNKANANIIAAMTASGFAFLSSTMLGEDYVIRLCPINPGLDGHDVAETLMRLDALAKGGLKTISTNSGQCKLSNRSQNT